MRYLVPVDPEGSSQLNVWIWGSLEYEFKCQMPSRKVAGIQRNQCLKDELDIYFPSPHLCLLLLEFQTLGHIAWPDKKNLRAQMRKGTSLSLLGLSPCKGPLGWLTGKTTQPQGLLDKGALKIWSLKIREMKLKKVKLLRVTQLSNGADIQI